MAPPKLTGPGDQGDERYVVSVRDSVHEALTARPAVTYASPPQPYQQALTLAIALLGHYPPESAHPADARTWTAATAGGRRVVSITPHPRLTRSPEAGS